MGLVIFRHHEKEYTLIIILKGNEYGWSINSRKENVAFLHGFVNFSDCLIDAWKTFEQYV